MHNPLSLGSLKPTPFSHCIFLFRANPTLYFQSLLKLEAKKQHLQCSKQVLLGSSSNQPHHEIHVIIGEGEKKSRDASRAAQITCIVKKEHGKSCMGFLSGIQNNRAQKSTLIRTLGRRQAMNFRQGTKSLGYRLEMRK